MKRYFQPKRKGDQLINEENEETKLQNPAPKRVKRLIIESDDDEEREKENNISSSKNQRVMFKKIEPTSSSTKNKQKKEDNEKKINSEEEIIQHLRDKNREEKVEINKEEENKEEENKEEENKEEENKEEENKEENQELFEKEKEKKDKQTEMISKRKIVTTKWSSKKSSKSNNNKSQTMITSKQNVPSHLQWTGDKVPYKVLSDTFELIEKESSRLKIIEHLRELFSQVIQKSEEDLVKILYLSINKLAPSYKGIEFGIGEALLLKVVAESTGRTPAVLKKKYQELGDIGLLAQSCRSTQPTMFSHSKLTVQSVFSTFWAIANEQGHSAMNKKKQRIQQLLVCARDNEANYLLRSLQGKLRIGLAEKSVLIALAQALVLTPPKRVLMKLNQSSPNNTQTEIKNQIKQEEEIINEQEAEEEDVEVGVEEEEEETEEEVDKIIEKKKNTKKNNKIKKIKKQTTSATTISSSSSDGVGGGTIVNRVSAERMNRAVEVMKSVYSELPSYDQIIEYALQYQIEELPKFCYLTPGIPVHPMLAQPTKGLSEVLDRFTDTAFTCEFKYDGERAQIHLLPNGKIQIYSRNMEDNTGKYPDVILNLPFSIIQEEGEGEKPEGEGEREEDEKMSIEKGETNNCNGNNKKRIESFILDCEAVAFDPTNKKILPFQILSTRARKTVKLEDIKVPVCLFAFDLLYLNGESLVKQPLRVRREKLFQTFRYIEGKFEFAKFMNSNDVNEIQIFLNEAIKQSCEGLMVKSLDKDSSYEPSRRSFNWLKVKKDYLAGLTDSFDLVPIGAYYGKGKRTGVYGGYLVACYDDESEEYQSITKLGTGFSEKALEDLTRELEKHKLPNKPLYYRHEGDDVDVWFDPVQVWEIQAADISLSPAYQAACGIVSESKGLSLRFPRFIRQREDKSPEQATSAAQISDMYRRQAVVVANNNNNDDEDDDYF